MQEGVRRVAGRPAGAAGRTDEEGSVYGATRNPVGDINLGPVPGGGKRLPAGRRAIHSEERVDRTTMSKLQETAWRGMWKEVEEGKGIGIGVLDEANGGDRTRCLRPGQPALCRLSYVRGMKTGMRPAGVEPAAFGAGNRRSGPLSYGRAKVVRRRR